MAPYAFRKYTGYNPNEVKCWSTTSPISPDNFIIEDIVHSNGSSKAGTSIPSPLARMELFDTAFQIVATDQKNNLEGKTIYHQLVSDCLDVLQLIYNMNSENIGQGKKLWFKEWVVQDNIERLKSKGESHPHYLLGKSLEQIFFDPIGSGFTGTDSIFLIYYENKLLGGTSPLTLVFTSPNWARYLKDREILDVPGSTDGDVFFDSSYRPLHLRDKAFVEYVYKLLTVYRSSFDKADGLRKYINKTIDLYFEDLKRSVGQAQGNMLDQEYSKVQTHVGNKLLTINGIFFYHQLAGKEKIKTETVSDFLIRATETKYRIQYNDAGQEQKVFTPLVLLDGMNMPGDYIDKNAPWNPNTKIRDFYHRHVPLYDRKLPMGNSQSIEYPFLTTEDFLEDILIAMPFDINSQKFYSGFGGNFKYLLPIKKEYFNFFSFKDLKNNLTILLTDGGVRVLLKVPIKNKKGVTDITFTKTYKIDNGSITECAADIGIYPFYQVTATDPSLSILNDYTVLLANRIETDIREERVSLKFFNYRNFASDTGSLPKTTLPRTVHDGAGVPSSKYYKIKELFDYMEFAYQYDTLGSQCKGLIIPNFDTRSFNAGSLRDAFTFAIDFGTSNTHVAYKKSTDELPQPFEIGEEDQQMVLLNAPDNNSDLGLKYDYYGRFPSIDLTLRREFVPAIITSKSKKTVSFPFKTATCEVADFSNSKNKSELFSHINIGYYIDRESPSNSVVYTTNLKWLLENNNDDTNQLRVKFFLKQLLMQIKAKVVLNNGKLSDLSVVWSVPSSMGGGNRTALKKVLQTAFNEVFELTNATLKEPIPESVAPYFFLTRSNTGIQEMANVINVDIGGGTTDIMMFMESSGSREDKLATTSFRFAGNDIWGSGFKGRLKDNGFITNYLAYQKANNINPEEARFFNKVKEDGNLSADDLVSLLFRYDASFHFSDSITIGNIDLSVILYLHYSAIIYHIAEIVHLKGYPLPRYLSFTGKGSQYIKMICGGDEKELENFTRLLLKSYSDQPLQASFKIHLNENPKEITANGSVLYDLAESSEKEKYEKNGGDFEFIHAGFNPWTAENVDLKKREAVDERFLINDVLQVNSQLNVSVLNNLNTFLEKTLGNREIIDFLGEFKIKNLRDVLNVMKWTGDIDNGEGFVYDSYRKVLASLHKPDSEADKLPESLFFFGLKDALYLLSKHITANKAK